MSTGWSTRTAKSELEVGDLIKNANKPSEESIKEEIAIKMYGDDRVLGINESRFTGTINLLTRIHSKMVNMFTELSERMEDTSYFNCSASDSLNKQMHDISMNIPIIENNYDSYISDLEIVKKDFGVIQYNEGLKFIKAKNSIYTDKYEEKYKN